MKEMSLAVVGARLNKDGAAWKRAIGHCKMGEPVQLRREPTNRHDRRAVAVLNRNGEQMGYISAERAPMIGPKLASAKAIFQEVTHYGAVIRINLAGERPSLPASKGRWWTTDEYDQREWCD